MPGRALHRSSASPHIDHDCSDKRRCLDDLVDLNAADAKATGVEREHSEARFLNFKWKLIEERAPLTLSDLEIDGNDLVSLGLEGEEIGAALDEMFRTCVVDPKLNNREWLLDHAAKLASRAAEKKKAD